jgi:hypothetical protein
MTRSSRPNTSAFWIALVPIADRKRRLGPCPIFRVYLKVFGKLFFLWIMVLLLLLVLYCEWSGSWRTLTKSV